MQKRLGFNPLRGAASRNRESRYMFTFRGSVIVEIRGGRRVVFAPLGPRALRLFACIRCTLDCGRATLEPPYEAFRTARHRTNGTLASLAGTDEQGRLVTAGGCGAGRLPKNCSWLRHNESLKPGFDSELCRGFRCVIRPESDLCLSQPGQGARRYLCPEQGSVLNTR